MIARSFLLLGSCAVILSACTSTPTDDYTPLPQMTFEHLLQIPVEVSDIDFDVATQRGAKPWDIANDLPTPPDVAMRRYLEQRYKAMGADGVLTIELEKADIHHESIPNPSPFLRHVTFTNNDEYTYEIIVNIAARYLSGHADRDTSLRFVRKEVLAPHVTPAYREARLQRVLEEVIRDIDEAMIREFAHEFKIVKERNIPVKSIDIKTEDPVVDTVVIEQRKVN